MSDREQCLPYKGGAADRVVRDRGGRVIAAAADAAAAEEEDFGRVRAWVTDLARLRAQKFCRCSEEVNSDMYLGA